MPAKSPVFTHLASTLNGLHTVRAHGAETSLMAEFDNHQDTHSACWYMTISTGSMFGLSLDGICFIFTCCVLFYCMHIGTKVVAIKIIFAMNLTELLQWGE